MCMSLLRDISDVVVLFTRLFPEMIAVVGIFAPLLEYVPRRPVSFGWGRYVFVVFFLSSAQARGHFTNQVGGVM